MVVVKSQGAMGPAVEEIVFPIEHVQFEPEILGGMMVECSVWWLAEFWEVFPLCMQGKSSIRGIVIVGGDKGGEVWEGCGSD